MTVTQEDLDPIADAAITSQLEIGWLQIRSLTATIMKVLIKAWADKKEEKKIPAVGKRKLRTRGSRWKEPGFLQRTVHNILGSHQTFSSE